MKKKIKSEEAQPVTVATKYRSFKPSINFKKNRAVRKTTLSCMRKTKKAANLARRRGLATTSIQVVKVAQPQLILAAPSAPIKKKKHLSITSFELSRPIKLEQVLLKCMPFIFISILRTLKMHPLIEQDEPIDFRSILKPSKCEIRPIMEVDESENFSKSAQPSQVEQDIESSTTTTENDDEHNDDIDFGRADEVDDIELPVEGVEEPVQVTNISSTPPKKSHCRQYKAVESSLDGQYWTVVSVRRSSRIRRKPNFYSPS